MKVVYDVLEPYFNEHMQISTRIPEEVRIAAQNFIDKRVSALSSNVPEKL